MHVSLPYKLKLSIHVCLYIDCIYVKIHSVCVCVCMHACADQMCLWLFMGKPTKCGWYLVTRHSTNFCFASVFSSVQILESFILLVPLFHLCDLYTHTNILFSINRHECMHLDQYINFYIVMSSHFLQCYIHLCSYIQTNHA